MKFELTIQEKGKNMLKRLIFDILYLKSINYNCYSHIRVPLNLIPKMTYEKV